MADDPGLLINLGLKLPDLVAGFAGGVVNAFVFKRADPWSVAGSMVVGAFTANYLGEPATHLVSSIFGGTAISSGASAFVVGVTGMAICQGIMRAIQAWRPAIVGDQK